MSKGTSKSVEPNGMTRIVIKEGELTGHAHVAEGVGIRLVDGPGDTKILECPNGTRVSHDEHDTINVPPGKYNMHIAKQYDHLEELSKRVQD